MSEKRSTLSRTFLVNMTLLTFFCVMVFAYFWIYREYNRFTKDMTLLKSEYIESRKERLKDEVGRTVSYIRYMNSTTEKRLKDMIRERVYEAHSIAMNIHEANKGQRDDSEIITMIKDALRPIRFNQGRGYFFAGNSEGIEQLFADRPEMEGKDLSGLQDSQGQYVIRDMIRIVQEEKEGFYQYLWTKPDREGKNYPKIAFVKHFEPYDWFLGTGEYLDDVLKDIQQEALDRLIRIRFGKDGYIFGSSYTGDPLFTNGQITTDGKSIWEMTDPYGKKIIQEQRKIVENPQGGFLSYSWHKLNDPRPSPKISFVRGVPEWQWIIGAGAYTDEVESVIQQKREVLGKDIENYIIRIIGILLTLLIIVYLTARYMSRRIMENVSIFTSFFEAAATKHIRIEAEHLHYGEFEKLAVSANRMIEDRKQIESALKKNEERFRSFFEHAAVGIAHIETDGSYIIANDTYCRIVGYNKDEIAKLRFQDITHPDDLESDRKRMQELLKGSIDKSTTHKRYIRKDGSVIWGNVGISLVRKRSGEADYFISVLEDISQKKQMEDSLRISEARYRELFDNMSSGVAVYEAVDEGTDFVFRDFNRTGERIEKLKKESLMGKKVTEVFPGVKSFGLFAVFQRVWRTGKPEQHSVSMYRDGRISGWRENYVYKLPTGEIVAMYDDISDRKKAEEELKKTKNYLDNILTSSPYPLIGLDTKGKISVFNPAAEKLSGIPVAEAWGEIFSDVMTDFKDCCKDIMKVMGRRDPLIREKVRKEKNGEIQYYDIVIYPLISEGPDGVVLRIDNVTQRVRFEEMMIQTEKMMSVGGLAAGMAHEINNPLGGILQSTQNILRRISPEMPKNAEVAALCGTDLEAVRAYMEKRSILRFLDGIRISGEKAADIVQNMLSFSRRSESRMAPIDIPELLDKTVELAAHDYDLKKKYDFRQIEIIRDYSPDLPKVQCVATEMEQVILNLLRNAAHAMAGMKDRRLQAQIRMGVRKEEDRIRIEVEDKGPGIEEKIRKRVFEPFFTTKEVGEGTGLGLSVSYFIITNNHKGTMSVKSEPGQGSCFVIHIPITTE